MGIEVDYDRLMAAIAWKAEVVSPCHVRWDISGNCTDPIELPLQAHNKKLRKFLPLELRKQLGPQWYEGLMALGLGQHEVRTEGVLFADMKIRCRKCAWCLAVRAALWRRRATSETMASVRSWMCTFTLSPDEHCRVGWECVKADSRNGDVFERRPEDEQFRLRCAVIGRYFTRYWKRVRKESGAPLRYLLIAERHTEKLAGLPHYHALVHERDALRPVRKRVLKSQWPYGFTDVKLVEDVEQATYPCKYLSKEMATRVRASLHYGIDVQIADLNSIPLPSSMICLDGNGQTNESRPMEQTPIDTDDEHESVVGVSMRF